VAEQDKPQPLFICLSWHLKQRPYKLSTFSDELWRVLVAASSVKELLAYRTNPVREHCSLHEVFREHMKVPKFSIQQSWLEPSPKWCGDRLREFVNHYVFERPEVLRHSDDDGGKDKEIDSPKPVDPKIEFRHEEKPQYTEPVKRGRGRPRKVGV